MDFGPLKEERYRGINLSAIRPRGCRPQLISFHATEQGQSGSQLTVQGQDQRMKDVECWAMMCEAESDEVLKKFYCPFSYREDRDIQEIGSGPPRTFIAAEEYQDSSSKGEEQSDLTRQQYGEGSTSL